MQKLLRPALFGLLLASACANEDRTDAVVVNTAPTEAAPTAVVRPEGALEIVLPVDGMVCEGCESTIREKLSALDGVVSCTASHTGKTATVVYDPTKVKPDALVAAIGETGYKARLPN
jgi:copper chaperone CopZ